MFFCLTVVASYILFPNAGWEVKLASVGVGILVEYLHSIASN